MLGSIDQAVNSEYSGAGDLLGLDGMESELMGYLGRLSPLKRIQAVKKLSKPTPPSQGSRAEMEKFFPELPDHIREQLLSGKLRLADHILYSIKPINGSKTIKMFETQDVKEVGLRNIDRGKLPKNMALLVSGIILLQGVAASAGTDDVKSANYDQVDAKGALATGELTLRSNKKAILSDTSLSLFRTNNFTVVPRGYYKLSNPRLIHDDVDIECDINLGTVTGVAANTYLFLGLHGTVTIP